MEAQIAFPLLLNRFPTLRLADGAQRRDRLTLRGYASLPVTLA
jgi:cytochrome P450